jgi:pimeloyl-ACP methyl ester carboxylesterase
MAIVLLPGFMLDDGLWDDMAPLLQPIGPIHYGDLSQNDTIAGMARHVLASAPARFVLVGFSMGGYVAREMARLAPDRVTALVLVATSGRADTPSHARRKGAATERISQGGFRGMSRAAIARAFHPSRAADSALIEHVQAMGNRLGGEVFIRQSTLRRLDEADRLGEITCPTLVIAAAQDALRSVAEAEELQRGIPGATMRIVEGSGHMIPIEAPRELAALIMGWLGEIRPSQVP